MSDNLHVINFQKSNIPVAYESKETADTKFVNYGYDNLYPNFILSLYNDSPIHASIINSKCTYIIGDGLKTDNGTDVDFSVNASDNIKELVDKLIKDYLIFNAFAIEVCFNSFGVPIEYHHVPVNKVRCNKSKTKFWFNEDWSISRKTIQYERFTKNNSDSTSKLYYFDGYFPSLNNVYSQPEYNGAIKSILTGIEISKFNLNNIKNHFSVSNIISFFRGSNVPEETKLSILKELKQTYTGSEGQKYIVDFQAPDGKSAEVKSLSANDWDKAYLAVSEAVKDEIFIAHSITSPMLFGVKTAGQLGGSTELTTSYEIFKNTYIRVKRDELESALNELFIKNENVKGRITFKDKPLFNTQLSDVTKEKVLTINELRAEAGLKPLPDGDRLLSEVPRISESVPTNQPTNPVQQDEIKKKSGKQLTADDFELIKHLGSSYEDFEILDSKQPFHFDIYEQVAEYVISNDIKGLTLSELNDIIKKETGLKTSVNTLRDVLNQLNDSRIVNVSYDDNERIQILPVNTPDVPETDKVSVMYKYVKRPEAPGDVLIPTSRSFCVKLIENNRLYTREDIQSMGEIFGYDIFQFAGGWYHNPESGETTSHCRHKWQALRVKRRNNNNPE